MDSPEKWESILQLYNKLLQIEYSPIAALNRTYALSKANGKLQAISEAEKLGLTGYGLYHSLLGNLYTGIDGTRALEHFPVAFNLAKSNADKTTIQKNIDRLKAGNNGNFL
jgi:RNA polymerase sigma-70 factor (ECF subfamily)